MTLAAIGTGHPTRCVAMPVPYMATETFGHSVTWDAANEPPLVRLAILKTRLLDQYERQRQDTWHGKRLGPRMLGDDTQ